MASVLNVITLLALLSALVLVSNTMTTLIGEQTGEIAAMKAIGARRRDIRRHLPAHRAAARRARRGRSASALGVLLANALVGLLRVSCSSASTPASASRVPILLASLVRRARRPAAGGAAGDPPRRAPAAQRGAAGHRLGGRRPGPPRRRCCGARASCRAARRSGCAASAGASAAPSRPRLQVALAVATLLALLSLGAGVATTTRGWFDDNHFDIWVQTVASKPFDADAGRADRRHRRRRAARSLAEQRRARRRPATPQAWGLPARPLMNTRIDRGPLVQRRRGRATAPASRCSGGRSPRPPARTSATASG